MEKNESEFFRLLFVLTAIFEKSRILAENKHHNRKENDPQS